MTASTRKSTPGRAPKEKAAKGRRCCRECRNRQEAGSSRTGGDTKAAPVPHKPNAAQLHITPPTVAGKCGGGANRV